MANKMDQFENQNQEITALKNQLANSVSVKQLAEKAALVDQQRAEISELQAKIGQNLQNLEALENVRNLLKNETEVKEALQHEISNLKSQLTEAVENLTTSIAADKLQLENLSQENAMLNNQLTTSHDQIEDLNKLIEGQEKELKLFEQEQEELFREKDELLDKVMESETLAGKLEKSQADLDAAKAKIEELEQKILASESQANATRTTSADMTADTAEEGDASG